MIVEPRNFKAETSVSRKDGKDRQEMASFVLPWRLCVELLKSSGGYSNS